MKVVTGYRMTPVELPSVGAAAHGRGFVFNLQRMLLRVRLACRHGVAALQRWSAQELGRPLVSADVRMTASVCALLVAVCTGAALLIVPALGWTSAEVGSLLKREKGGHR